MFARLHNNSEYEGTGIGLALCKKIVDEHNGFISARSKLNEGSTFIISLPVNMNGEAGRKQSLGVFKYKVIDDDESNPKFAYYSKKEQGSMRRFI